MRPILFNTEMVLAILEGRKTETRGLNGLAEVNENPDQWNLQDLSMDPELRKHDKNGEEVIFVKKGLIATFENTEYGECYRNIKAPYQQGYILYVREKFNNTETTSVLYAADKDFIDYGCKEVDEYLFLESEIKWQPSIHMPKEAARIFLKVTDVRVERVQDITGESAQKEGMEGFIHTNPLLGMPETVRNFKEIWDRLYKNWSYNPWVWVIKFERIEKEAHDG